MITNFIIKIIETRPASEHVALIMYSQMPARQFKNSIPLSTTKLHRIII